MTDDDRGPVTGDPARINAWLAVFGLLAIAGCQSTTHNYYADNGASINLTDSGRSEQARGGQTSEALNPRVDNAGDIGLPEGL